MEEIDEQDISKSKSPHDEILEMDGSQEHSLPSRPLDDNDYNDNDKKGIFNSLAAIQ